MAQDPVPTIIIVNRLHTSREPLVVQLLHTRGNIPGSAPLSRVKELRTHCRKTMSYCVTASPDPTDPDGKKLVVHKRWVSFLMSKQAFNDLFTANWHAFDPHQLIYELGHAKKPETVKVVVSKILRWGHYVYNSSVSVFLDRAFHFMGYENGVFSDFIAPVQAILADTANSDRDDKEDHMEDVTVIVTEGLLKSRCSVVERLADIASTQEAVHLALAGQAADLFGVAQILFEVGSCLVVVRWV